MTQTLNASHTSLTGSKESLAEEASTGKQAGRQDTGIGHVGLRATNLAASVEFYREVFGMEITGGSAPDHRLGASAFLSSRPGAIARNSLVRQPCFCSHRLQGLFTFRAPILPRARCGEEDPDQVCIQPPRVLRILFRRP